MADVEDAFRRVLTIPGRSDWEPVTVWLEPGEVAVNVVASQPVFASRGPFRDRPLVVTLDFLDADGVVTRRERKVSRAAGRTWLESFDELGHYLKRLAPAGDIEALDRELFDDLVKRPLDDPLSVHQAEGGPGFDALTIKDALKVLRSVSLSPDFTYGDVRVQRMSDTPGAIREMLELAYRLGREVRDAEFSTELKRTGGYRRQETLNAEEWWRQGASWAQKLFDTWPNGWKDGRRKSMNGVASEMDDRWNSRPFAPKGPPNVQQHDLAKRVLPEWVKRGLVNFRKPPA